MGKKPFFQNYLKITFVSQNVDIFRHRAKKKHFFKGPFSRILIFSQIWTKNVFFKRISKQRSYFRNSDFFDILKIIFSKNLTFSSYVDIIGDIHKKQFFQNDLKKTIFSSNVNIFGYVMLIIFMFIFSATWAKNPFFKMISK